MGCRGIALCQDTGGGYASLVKPSGSPDSDANTVTLLPGGAIHGDLNIDSNGASTLTLSGTGTQSWSRAVTGGTTFAGTLIKAGTGTWTIDAGLSTIGQTNVTGGSLLVSNTLITSQVTVSGGQLGGSGIVAGNITVGSGGAIGGGDGTNFDTLTTGSQTWDDGSTVDVAIGNNQASFFNVSGAITLSGTITFALNDLQSFDTSQDAVWTLANANGITVNSGAREDFVVSGFATGISASDFNLDVTTGSAGIQILNLVYTPAVPEPSTVALAIGGLLGVGILRRWRTTAPSKAAKATP